MCKFLWHQEICQSYSPSTALATRALLAHSKQSINQRSENKEVPPECFVVCVFPKISQQLLPLSIVSQLFTQLLIHLFHLYPIITATQETSFGPKLFHKIIENTEISVVQKKAHRSYFSSFTGFFKYCQLSKHVPSYIQKNYKGLRRFTKVTKVEFGSLMHNSSKLKKKILITHTSLFMHTPKQNHKIEDPSKTTP